MARGSIVLIALAVASLGACGALIGANDPIEAAADASAPDVSPADDAAAIDVSAPDVGSCPLCPAPPMNATETCNGSACGFECNAGYHRCGNQCNRDDDSLACGAACARCFPGGTGDGVAICDGGVCAVQCDPGWTDCDQSGFCTGLQWDPGNCGACGHVCPGGPLYGRCTNGVCQ